DFFACVPLVPGQRLDLAQAFVIPWEAISGKTFYLPDSRRSYAGKFATYRNAWGQIGHGEAGEPALASDPPPHRTQRAQRPPNHRRAPSRPSAFVSVVSLW